MEATQEEDVWSNDELYDEICSIPDSANVEEKQTTPVDKTVELDIGIIDGKELQTSDTESDDNIPLANLIKKRKQLPVRRKLIENSDLETEISDDSLHDKTYHVSEDEYSTSETSCELSVPLPVTKRAKGRLEDGLDKQRKKKVPGKKIPKERQSNKHKDIYKKLQERIKLLKARRMVKSFSNRKNISKAKRISSAMQSVKTMIANSHKVRIDNLLESNELCRVPIKADGNCFFAALMKSSKMPELHTKQIDQLREEVCQHMLDEKEKYINFFENDQEFDRSVHALKQSGNWKSSAADCLPLAVANKYHCIIRIFSSAINTPLYDVNPCEEASKSLQVISLAYLAIRDEEHYDATTPMTEITSTSSSLLLRENRASQQSPDTVKTALVNTHQTPHKRADYQSPKKSHMSRKRPLNKALWKRNIRKNARLNGERYVSEKGKVMEAKHVKPLDCSRCRFKCSDKFSDADRQKIFTFYYSLGSYERQRHYICDMIIKADVQRKGKGKKTNSLKYFLSCDARTERVCRNFFKKTLDISNKLISYTIGRKKIGAFSGKDNRGQQPSANKTTDTALNFIHDHIKSFPKMESHYARKYSKKQYLAADLNIRKMWGLYQEECDRKGISSVGVAKYRKVFCESFNLSFFKPKKDQCSLCARYERHIVNKTCTEQLKAEYDNHPKKKIEAREEKEKDKKKALENKDFYVATFDLQAVLTTPCALVSELYYSRKLCCYNLTVYSLGDKQVFCHLWNETQGKRGSCEIATCLLKNTESVCSSNKQVKEITYYSDTCSGQNRNQYVAASYMYALSKLNQLQCLNHKFLQSGHSQMECDSVHSAIELAKKNTSVYVPSQWSTVVCLGRKAKPYLAIPLKFDQVLNFKSLVKKHSLKLNLATNGVKINWLSVRWIQVRRDRPRSVFVNYSFDPTQFSEINTESSFTRRRGRLLSWPKMDTEMDHCYSEKLPISVQKKKDLVDLCRQGIIPEEFHQYYESLPVSQKMKDRLPDLSVDEDSDIDSD